MKTDRLEARVKAKNRANAYANRVRPLLAAALLPFVGKQLFTAAGPLLAKVAKALPELPEEPNLRSWRHTSDYNMVWGVSADEPEGGSREGCHTVVYEEAMVYVGKLEHGVLTAIYAADATEPLKDNYTVAEVLANREAYKAAKKVADDMQSRLEPFGEYDH